jgi:hypothetical protein
VQTDDGNTYALFGNGVYGAIPAIGQEIFATFRVGGGARGNLTRETIETKVNGHANILSVTNPEESSGGIEPISLRAARNGITATLSTLDRAVTAPD